MPKPSCPLSFRAYALRRKGTTHMWDGIYDILDSNGTPLHIFKSVPSAEGFGDPALAILAAEIFASRHIDDMSAKPDLAISGKSPTWRSDFGHALMGHSLAADIAAVPASHTRETVVFRNRPEHQSCTPADKRDGHSAGTSASHPYAG